MMIKTSTIVASLVGTAMAFTTTPSSGSSAKSMRVPPSQAVAFGDGDRSIFDPMNLYPANSPEKKQGLIQPLERRYEDAKPVIDPLNHYRSQPETPLDVDVDMSDSLPFLPRPATLKGELAGDVGFDPFNFARTEEQLLSMRQAELKHARIAMLATVGWFAAELLHQPLADSWGLPSLLGFGDRVPSTLNGGLDNIAPGFYVSALIAASYFEFMSIGLEEMPRLWDPLGLYPKDIEGQKRMELAEIKNGRLAMVAIVGFAIQELFTHVGVVHNLLN